MNDTEARLNNAIKNYWQFDLSIGLFKVFAGGKMEGNMHIELTRNMVTGEVKREDGGTVTEGMLSAIAALDLCKRGAYHDEVGGWVESNAMSLRWYCVVVKKQENENV